MAPNHQHPCHRVTATGTATLDGGILRVLAQAGTYDPRTRYAILNAAGGVTGQFAGVTSNFALRPRRCATSQPRST